MVHFPSIDLTSIPTPFYHIDERVLRSNLEKMVAIKAQTGCQILLATKAYSCFKTYPLIAQYLDGTTNSSVYEARLSQTYFNRNVHVYAPAYSEKSLIEIQPLVHTLVFNSLGQFQRFKDRVEGIKAVGLRLNPEHIEVKNALYSPCVPGSRFGVLARHLPRVLDPRISGFHIHALCQNDDASLLRLMQATSTAFDTWLKTAAIKWVNFGGGHMISYAKYNTSRLCDAITDFQERYNVTVILEPGEAVVYQVGTLVATVLDIVHNQCDIAILDTSATAHMPDILEMPYVPAVFGAQAVSELGQPHTYRLGGITCLSGDSMGLYRFERPLAIGDRVTFLDMAQYTMVKNTTFNGVSLPGIVITDQQGKVAHHQTFDYRTFKDRLG